MEENSNKTFRQYFLLVGSLYSLFLVLAVAGLGGNIAEQDHARLSVLALFGLRGLPLLYCGIRYSALAATTYRRVLIVNAVAAVICAGLMRVIPGFETWPVWADPFFVLLGFMLMSARESSKARGPGA